MNAATVPNERIRIRMRPTLSVTQVHAPPQNLRRKTKKESPPAIDNFLKIVVSLGWLFNKGCGIVCR